MCTHSTNMFVIQRNRHLYCYTVIYYNRDVLDICTHVEIHKYIPSLTKFASYIYTYFIYSALRCCRNDCLGLPWGDRAGGLLAEGHRPFQSRLNQVLNADLLLGQKMSKQTFCIEQKRANSPKEADLLHTCSCCTVTCFLVHFLSEVKITALFLKNWLLQVRLKMVVKADGFLRTLIV